MKRILYFEAPDGISGDMALGALIDLGADADAIRAELDKCVPEPYALIPRAFSRGGISGISLDVVVDGGDAPGAPFPDNSLAGHCHAHSRVRAPGAEGIHGSQGHHHGAASEGAGGPTPHHHHGAASEGVGGPHAHQHPHGAAHGHEDEGEPHAHHHPHGAAHGHEGAGGPTPHHHPHGAAHEHRSYADIKSMIEQSGLTVRAKGYALSIFRVIAEAEAAVHSTPLAEVAFHEVGAMDSIVDIVGTAAAADLLGAEAFFCGALHDGSGHVLCRHGLIPTPVPAVMEMAKGYGVPIFIDADVSTEMITPTGFGIIKGLGARFEPHLAIIPERVGYGFGKRDTGRLGAVRATLGQLYE